jgi:DNA-binding PadR family transcriptional regulator
MAKLKKQTLDGNVETLLLAILESGPSYGYAIIEELKKKAEGLLELGEGTIYPVLHRMEEKELITSYWQNAENGRPRKYYRINLKGKTVLAENYSQWKTLSSVMEKVLGKITPENQLNGAQI